VITEIADYFSLGCGRCERFASADCSTRKWAGGLQALRELCIDLKLVETVKWAHPCYMPRDRNVAIIGATHSDFRLSFFNASLMKDPEGVLERAGLNTKHPDIIRFTYNSQVAAMEGTVSAYLKEAMSYADAGIKPPKDTSTIESPLELAEALDSDPELAEAFHRLTPGRQRSYVINLSSAKKAETRISRILGFRNRILVGKGALER
jgi:uncharacterized protein YdeI (YjbR/CyaY-like superfamily)